LTAVRTLVAAVAIVSAVCANAASRAPLPAMEWKKQFEQLETQLAVLRAEVDRLRRARDSVGASVMPPPVRGAAPARAPASPLERLPTVWMLESGCPAGSVCVQVRCADWGRP
jgi:hypothetical protein